MILLRLSSTAYEAARAMAAHRVCTVLVCEGHEVLGIVTDRDLVLGVAAGLDLRATLLSDLMSSDVATLPVDATLADVARLMRQRACRRIPLTEDGRPVGLVTLDDLFADGEFSQATRLAMAAQLDAALGDTPQSGVRTRPRERGFAGAASAA